MNTSIKVVSTQLNESNFKQLLDMAKRRNTTIDKLLNELVVKAINEDYQKRNADEINKRNKQRIYIY